MNIIITSVALANITTNIMITKVIKNTIITRKTSVLS